MRTFFLPQSPTHPQKMNINAQTPIELEFLLRLCGEVEWPSPEALKAQILKDVAKAKRYFRLAS
jgi:riboflavin kinase/FMN adenylyltransferase